MGVIDMKAYLSNTVWQNGIFTCIINLWYSSLMLILSFKIYKVWKILWVGFYLDYCCIDVMYYSAIHVKTLILHTKICSNLCQIFNTCTLIYMYLHRFLICHRYPFRVRPGLFANLHFFKIMYFLFFNPNHTHATITHLWKTTSLLYLQMSRK